MQVSRRILTGFMLLLLASPVLAQGNTQRDYRQSQLRLDSIRQERARLQREMTQLQSRVRDESRELENIGRQRAASISALQELDFQAAVLESSVEVTTADLDATREKLEDRSGALKERLRSIYKRGQLHTVRVLLSAESFGDLLNRYKYLRLATDYDRHVLEDVKRLEEGLREQEAQLRENMAQLDVLRSEKASEVDDLRRLEGRSRQTLEQVKRAEASTASQIEQSERDEARLSLIIDRLETERRAEEARAARAGATPAAPASITTASLGTLNWPVNGRIVYNFGPERKPNGITLTNNGIGIGAAAGTPVVAVQAGRVSHAGPFEGYGSMVMVNHGGGYYTLYMYLKSVTVREGQVIESNAQIGTVGGEQTPEGAHIEFQVRAPVRGTVPEPVDPLTWLRSRAGS